MKLLILITGVVACQGISLHEEWTSYKEQYGKRYNSHEDMKRKQIYVKTKAYINDHNMKFANGSVSFSMEINVFADLTEKEFHKWHLGFLKTCIDKEETKMVHQPPPDRTSLPKEVDWRAKGRVTPVKNQGKCSSSWAFSAMGALEGQHVEQSQHMVDLSEQQLIDCTHHTIFGNKGCRGGNPIRAFRYIKNMGIGSAEFYPYKAEELKCKYQEKMAAANLTSYVRVKGGSQLSLEDAVANVGPVSVVISVHKSLKFYKSGIYYEPRCDSVVAPLNHAVLAVGYGVENGHEYWLVKNSWGNKWGEEGYVKIIRNKGRGCGIADSASYPTVMQNFHE